MSAMLPTARVELSSELAAKVRGYLDHVIEDWADHPTEVGKIAQRLRVIPLSLDMGGFSALKPDGSVVAVAWDEPNVEQAINSTRERDIALLIGSKRYPELARLIPARPLHAERCPECGGTGVHPVAAKSGVNVVCWCGGLGWVPEHWDHD